MDRRTKRSSSPPSSRWSNKSRRSRSRSKDNRDSIGSTKSNTKRDTSDKRDDRRDDGNRDRDQSSTFFHDKKRYSRSRSRSRSPPNSKSRYRRSSREKSPVKRYSPSPPKSSSLYRPSPGKREREEKEETESKINAKTAIPIHPLLMEQTGTDTKKTSSRLPIAATSSVKANIRAGETSSLQTAGLKKKNSTLTKTPVAAFLSIRPTRQHAQTFNPYFDPKLSTAPKSHRPRKIAFIEQGKFIEEAERKRVEEEFEALRREVATGLGTIGVNSEMVGDLLVTEMVPNFEWWDSSFINKDGSINYAGITNLIQRPALLPPPIDPNSVVDPRPLFLTKTEQKKIRRQRRLAEQKDKQEQIKLGLLPPDPTKTRIANIARILETRSIQEPSKVEAEIRSQVEQRYQTHLQTNMERSEKSKELSIEREKEKKMERLASMTNVSVAVFRVRILTPPQWRFKVTKNAQQMNLSGCVLFCNGCNVIIAEGPINDLKRYKHLLLERMKWNEMPADFDPIEEENECVCVWEGVVRERTFNNFVGRNMASELDAREFLAKYGLEHYWKIAKDFSNLS